MKGSNTKRLVLWTLTIGIVLVLTLKKDWVGDLYLLYLSNTGKAACTYRDLRAGLAHLERSEQIALEWNRTAKLVRTEGRLELWNAHGVDWWIPAGSREAIPTVFGEMGSNFYGGPEHSVRKGDIVLDCGADVGVFTRQALDRGAAKVVAVEPFPDKEPCLRRNFAREIADGRVIVAPKGVWHEDSELEIFGDSVIEKKTEAGIKVPLTTIDKLVAELGLERVDFIKFDIEGAELNALRGGAQTIRKWKPRIAVATEHATDDYITVPKLIREIEPAYTADRCNVCADLKGSLRPISMTLDAK